MRALGYAGAAMTSALVERCDALFRPSVFVNHYGCTEIYTFSIGADQRGKPGCAGPARAERAAAIGRGRGDLRDLDSDEAFSGYWNRPDADARAIRDGWYHTGDPGRLDEDGDLWLEGRADDMIISGGENVHPLEIEDVLARHPGVREVAVVGAPDDRLGPAGLAVVVGETHRRGARAHCLAPSWRAGSARASTASWVSCRSLVRQDPAPCPAR